MKSNTSLLEHLQLCANDPMWADHAEVPKVVLRTAIKVVKERDALRQRIKQQNAQCLHPLECPKHGKCLSLSCKNLGRALE